VARSRRVLSRPISNRRETSWSIAVASGTNGSEQTISASGSTGLTQFAIATVDGITIVRLRGELLLYLLTASGASSGFTGAFGIGKATLQAGNIGITALPTPLDEEDWDGWLYHRYFSVMAADQIVGANAATNNANQNPQSAALRVEVDSKAMRKLPENNILFGALQVLEVGTSTMAMHFNSRMLLKLP